MRTATAARALRVQEILGGAFTVVEFEASTRTAADAAAAVGCEVGQIAKSLVFRAESGRPVLVVASGANRVDEAKVARFVGEPIGRADAAFVRETTGYPIGGVAPIGHASDAEVLLDEDLQAFEAIWASGGTPNAVFRLTPADLARLTEAPFRDVARR